MDIRARSISFASRPRGQKGHLITNAPKTAVNQPRRRVHCAVMRSFFRCSVFGHQFLPPAVNQKALRSISDNLAKFTANRRVSSCVSRFGRRAVRRIDMSGIGEEAEVRGLRLKSVAATIRLQAARLRMRRISNIKSFLQRSRSSEQSISVCSATKNEKHFGESAHAADSLS